VRFYRIYRVNRFRNFVNLFFDGVIHRASMMVIVDVFYLFSSLLADLESLILRWTTVGLAHLLRENLNLIWPSRDRGSRTVRVRACCLCCRGERSCSLSKCQSLECLVFAESTWSQFGDSAATTSQRSTLSLRPLNLSRCR
jgi:hypothetical protein